MIDALRDLVERESPSGDVATTTALRDHLVDRWRPFGRVRTGAAGDGAHPWAIVDVPGAGPATEPVVVACHFDTVWGRGTLTDWPFAVDGAKVSGPGVFDMKAGIVMLEEAIGHALRRHELRRPVRVVLSSDEEIGSPLTRTIVPGIVSDAWCALVLEPPLACGMLKSRRKGSATYRIVVEGREAHSALDPENGISAILEASTLVRRLDVLPDSTAGDQLNIGTIAGGSRVNVVPGRVELNLSVRSLTKERARALDRAIHALLPEHPEARLRVERVTARPPMELTSGSAELIELVQRAGTALGLTIGHGTSPGASDGNLLGASGLPVLDGLGARGAGAHARHEHVEAGSLVDQSAVLVALLAAL